MTEAEKNRYDLMLAALELIAAKDHTSIFDDLEDYDGTHADSVRDYAESVVHTIKASASRHDAPPLPAPHD